MCEIIKEIKTENNYDFSNYYDNNEIEKVAIRILEDFEINTYPVPIVTIAKKVGFESFATDMKDDSVSGLIAIDVDFKKDFGTDKIMMINKKENPGHRKFTIAHELGHYIFDFNETEQTKYYNAYIIENDYTNIPSEIRANRFAAALLMPQTEFRNKYTKFKKKEYTLFEIVSSLAEYFSVSRTAIEKRIRELELSN